MLIEVPEKVAKKIVVKRDGKKVEFDGAKIALAIQKGFGDIVGNEDPKTAKYNETDVNKVYSKVLGRIEKIDSDKIKIEEIQDLIEEELKNLGYQDVYGAFASYREKRAQSRQLFFDEKKQHKFLKALENLGLKSANVEENKKDPMSINKREKAILRFIEKQVEEKGYAPSVREIGKAVGLKSTATVHGYLAKLSEKGYIKKEDQKGRTLRLLKGGDGEPVKKHEDKNYYTGREMVDVPVIGKITAGEPILAVENITDTFPIPIDFVGNSESFMLTVRGESMIEAGILNGDYILVKKQNTALNGEIVVALIGDEATVKTFYKEKDHIRLQPQNSTMDPIIVPTCEILGKVAGVFRKL